MRETMPTSGEATFDRFRLTRAAGVGLLIAAAAYLGLPIVFSMTAALGMSLVTDPLELASQHWVGVVQALLFATVGIGLVVTGLSLSRLLADSLAARAGAAFATAAAGLWFVTGALEASWTNRVFSPATSDLSGDVAVRETALWAGKTAGSAVPLAALIASTAFLVSSICIASARARLVGKPTVVVGYVVSAVFVVVGLGVGAYPVGVVSVVAWLVAGTVLIRKSRHLNLA